MTGAVTAGSLLAGAGISAAAGMASNIGSNVANKNIQQMNNEFNERMLQKQMDYNKEMYQTQLSDSLKYSDPTFLRNRLEGAGYNAGVLAAGGNLGSAVSTPTAQGITPQPAASRVANFDGIGSAIGGAIDLYNRSAKTSAEVNNMRIEGKFIAQKAIAELNESLSRTKNNEARTATEEVLRGIRRDMMAMETDLNREQAQKVAVERRGQIIQNAMASTQLSYLPQQIKMTLANGAADIALKKQQEKLTNQQVKHEVEKLAETIARQSLISSQTEKVRSDRLSVEASTAGQKLQNQFDAETFKNRKRKIAEEINSLLRSNRPINLFQMYGQPYTNNQGDILNW